MHVCMMEPIKLWSSTHGPSHLHFFHKPLGNRCPFCPKSGQGRPIHYSVCTHLRSSSWCIPTFCCYSPDSASVPAKLHMRKTMLTASSHVHWGVSHTAGVKSNAQCLPHSFLVCLTTGILLALFWILETYGCLYGLITTKQNGWNHTHPLPLCDPPISSSLLLL